MLKHLDRRAVIASGDRPIQVAFPERDFEVDFSRQLN